MRAVSKPGYSISPAMWPWITYEEGILFEADHFPNPTNGQMAPAQPVTKRLAEAIDQKGLDVKIIVGAHSPRIASIDDLRESLSLSRPK